MLDINQIRHSQTGHDCAKKTQIPRVNNQSIGEPEVICLFTLLTPDIESRHQASQPRPDSRFAPSIPISSASQHHLAQPYIHIHRSCASAQLPYLTYLRPAIGRLIDLPFLFPTALSLLSCVGPFALQKSPANFPSRRSLSWYSQVGGQNVVAAAARTGRDRLKASKRTEQHQTEDISRIKNYRHKPRNDS
ncbi:uncharacterized protein LAJ45_06054 [Morchella importuna]|uniref:uncharacterized protein n=1 Tax=Morchella importuna TaxID=1174673 RepID=UPI001E8EC23E|nr:uncharacterized protein LAJ45_06054 [Morchella importuna]KAH8149902.1 hypothetical protein LAJ45_06054 [Morchella importuna]